jgi:hypothetical protein
MVGSNQLSPRRRMSFGVSLTGILFRVLLITNVGLRYVNSGNDNNPYDQTDALHSDLPRLAAAGLKLVDNE